MDYGAILKKSWTTIWRYKILWLFGLFAGAGGGFSSNYNFGNNSNSGTGTGSNPFTSTPGTAALRFLEQNLGLVIIGFLVLFLIGLLLWIVSIAARGGLIHLANEAEAGREVRAADGWGTGFHKWGRLFGIEFLAALPVLLLVFVLAGVVGVGAAVALRSGSTQALTRTLGGLACGGLLVAVVFGLVAVVLGVILGIVAQVALRYAVLQDMRVMDSLRQGWRDLWSRRGVFTMWIILVGVGIAYGIAVGIVALILVVPAVLAIVITRAWVVGAGLILLAILVLIVPSSMYAAFYHTTWTLFFRRMTGMEPLAAVAYPAPPAPSYPPAPPVPPAAPFEPAPPAPPMPPAPMAEPASEAMRAPFTEPTDPPAGTDA